ncbi:SAM-dependent methyltransferase [Prauserella sp. PE36]|uniref:class I SAM-dependent methyltransferase n=1 Tax=Prauserella sp. PE36 TaxID=1504709 RepID=UPI000DE29ED3|nr:class I SAM-dependent methyltransferase [Prauserella sp. PE36]RBM12174.1 SAM-dependent methyltransferase [Prauserella sp. PE36]
MTREYLDGKAAERFARYYDSFNAPAERRWAGARRARMVGSLTGTVLEIGAGTGANLRHYRGVRELVAAEPSAAMRERLRDAVAAVQVPVDIVDATAERLPFYETKFDAVVCGLVLCSVTDLDRALVEIRRVLKPTGQLVFFEHIRADGLLGWVQDRIESTWARIAAGCRPNRRTVQAIRAAGFTVRELDIFRPWPRVPLVAPYALGAAIPRDPK